MEPIRAGLPSGCSRWFMGRSVRPGSTEQPRPQPATARRATCWLAGYGWLTAAGLALAAGVAAGEGQGERSVIRQERVEECSVLVITSLTGGDPASGNPTVGSASAVPSALRHQWAARRPHRRASMPFRPATPNHPRACRPNATAAAAAARRWHLPRRRRQRRRRDALAVTPCRRSRARRRARPRRRTMPPPCAPPGSRRRPVARPPRPRPPPCPTAARRSDIL